MAQNANPDTVTADGVTINDNGGIHVPAHVKDALGGCYGQTLAVEMPTPNADYVSAVEFEADIHAGGGITIPAEVRRIGGLSAGDVVDNLEFEQSGDPLDRDEKESLSDSPGAIEEDEEKSILDEVIEEFEGVDEEEPDDKSEESLEDLFA